MCDWSSDVCSSDLLGAHVTGIRKSRKPKPEYVDAQYTMEALPELLPQADIVALSLPGYSDTKGVIGEKELHLMKENTILLNVGRGTAIDSLALAKALQEGAIYGAGLDVTDPEPLPEDHPLWDAPHCIITPHVSGDRKSTRLNSSHTLASRMPSSA